jgi:hypothetical protein
MLVASDGLQYGVVQPSRCHLGCSKSCLTRRGDGRDAGEGGTSPAAIDEGLWSYINISHRLRLRRGRRGMVSPHEVMVIEAVLNEFLVRVSLFLASYHYQHMLYWFLLYVCVHETY